MPDAQLDTAGTSDQWRPRSGAATILHSARVLRDGGGVHWWRLTLDDPLTDEVRRLLA